MEASITSIALGIGLSAACGFRVFVPLLLMSGAAQLGYLDLASGFEWMETDRALVGLGIATAVEVLAYMIPWLDNALDTVASPAAVVAGIVASASVLGDTSPFVQWTLSLIAGGGVAGLVQGGSVATRTASSVGTGGLGNFLVAIGEDIAAVGTALLAILAPFIALAVVIGLVAVFVYQLVRWRRRSARRRYE